MAAIVLTPPQWVDWLKKLGNRYLPAAQRGVVAGAMRCLPLMQSRTDRAPPASLTGKPGAVNTGIFRNSWRASPVTNGARVHNLQPYGPVVEYGRRAKGVNRAGINNLQAWAKRKLQMSDSEARSAAFAIAKTLAKRPLLARKIMTGAIDKMTELVLAEVLHEMEVELKRP